MALLSLLVGSALAQSDRKSVVDPDELPENKALNRKYREMINRVPDGKESHDPWGSVRASDVTNKKKDKTDKKGSAADAK